MTSKAQYPSDGHALLRGVRAMNAGCGFVTAIAAKLLGDLGAEVISLEIPGHEAASLHWPALSYLSPPPKRADNVLHGLAENGPVDICILGGEDFPGVTRNDDQAQEILSRSPGTIVLRVGAHPNGVENSSPAVDILIQAKSGLVYEHYRDRPNLMTFQPTQYGAALHGVFGALAALISRGSTQSGQIVQTSLMQGALAWVTTWNEAERPDASFAFTTPIDPRPLILPCRDGDYVHIVFGSVNSKYATYQVLGIDDRTVQPGDSGVPNRNDPPEKFYGDVELLRKYARGWARDDLIAALTREGVAAAPVQPPGLAWDDAQVEHLGLIQTTPDGARHVGASIRQSVPDRGESQKAPMIAGLPLKGVRILDFGAFTAGPFSSGLLRKLGADVVKIEPLRGDPARNLPRAFMTSNHGKRSLAIDMKTPEGSEIVQELCATADVVCTNFRTGVAAKLGIDGKTLLARHSHMVILEAPAFGQTGPRAGEVAFDLALQALCGFEVRAGGIDNVPIWNRTFLADYAGGMLGAIGVLAALHNRRHNGVGAIVEASLLDAAFFLQSESIQRADGTFACMEILNEDQTGFAPAECLYPTSDGWLALAIRDSAGARALAGVLDLADLSDDWRSWSDRERHMLKSAFSLGNTADLLQALAAAGVWAERCERDMEHRTLTDPALLAARVVEQASNPHYGMVSKIGQFVSFSRSETTAGEMSPELGEHTDELLAELGRSGTTISELKARKIVA